MVNSSLQDILTAAETLPVTERAQLIDALWSQVSPADWAPPSDAWMAEVNQRSNQLDAGELSGSSWDEVRQRARRKAGLDD